MPPPLVLFVTILFVTNFSYGFDSSSTVKLYNILLKPFGVRLLDNKVPDYTPSLNCTGHLKELRACNSTIVNFLLNTTGDEENLVNLLITNCESGRYKCLQQQVLRNPVLREWFKQLKVVLHQMCLDQCWKIAYADDKDCSHSKTKSKTVGLRQEVLEAFCHQPKPLSSGEDSFCTDNFLEGLFSQVDNEGVSDDKVFIMIYSSLWDCNVKKSIEDKRCSSSCYQEIYYFYHLLGSCVSVVTNTMKKYSVSPSHNTFGVIVQNSTVMCGKNQPRSSIQAESSSHAVTSSNGQNQTTLTTTQMSLSGSTSLSGKLIAAIVVAVLVFGVAVAVSFRFVYQRFVNKPKLRFEDYGYSHLQMIQEQEDFYFNDDEDDHGLLDF